MQSLKHWQALVYELCQTTEADLTIRQMAVLLTVYLDEPPHTVRGLALKLRVGKPAITRALNKLELLGYIRRKGDEQDKRNLFIQRTVKGSVFLHGFTKVTEG
jgi:DNA-binding MarR family transcriptional regulator